MCGVVCFGVFSLSLSLGLFDMVNGCALSLRLGLQYSLVLPICVGGAGVSGTGRSFVEDVEVFSLNRGGSAQGGGIVLEVCTTRCSMWVRLLGVCVRPGGCSCSQVRV